MEKIQAFASGSHPPEFAHTREVKPPKILPCSDSKMFNVLGIPLQSLWKSTGLKPSLLAL
jgi:hypothetical protein